jgi:membrane-associated phospholipid phosphatase
MDANGRESKPGRRAAGFWPVDKVFLTYFGALTLLELIYWRQLASPFELVSVHVGGMLLIAVLALLPANPILNFVHYWYPLPFVFYSYKEMSIIIPALRAWDADAALARLDFAVWGANPTVWLERFRSLALEEGLQIVYSGFVPAILMVALVLWQKKQFQDFRYYAFLITLGFLTSYVGYLLVPARGPRFLLKALQTYELKGLWLFHWLRTTLDRIESAHYDCFPSGHTEMTILAWWGTRVISAKLFGGMFVYTLGVIFATVYLRYHYTVDVFAGAILAGALILVAPILYRALGGTPSE